MHQDPTQRELGQRRTVGHERAQLLDHLQAGFVVDASKSLAAVERLAAAVEPAVIVRRELRVAGHLAREQARGEWDTGDDPDVLALRLFEEEPGGPLAEDVEDDLDCGDDRVLDRL